jgi:hypothetical protein
VVTLLSRDLGAQRPVGPVVIDWGHPLASGLVMCVPFVEGGGKPRELVYGDPLSFGGTAPVWARGGLTAAGSAAAYASIPLRSIHKVSIPYTTFAALSFTDSGNTVVWEINGNSGFSMQVGNGGAGRFGLNPNNNVSPWAPDSTAYNNGAFRTYAVAVHSTSSGGAIGAINGRVRGVDGVPVAPNYGSATTIDLFSRAGSFGFAGALYEVALWDRALSPDELTWITAEPYAFLAQAVDRRYFLVPKITTTITGTGASTLAGFTCSASGAETISGTASATLAGFTSSAAGAETISGTTAVTLAGFTASGAGALTLAGSSAVTLDGITASASGALTITGTLAVTLDGFTCHAYQADARGGSGTATLTTYHSATATATARHTGTATVTARHTATATVTEDQ